MQPYTTVCLHISHVCIKMLITNTHFHRKSYTETINKIATIVLRSGTQHRSKSSQITRLTEYTQNTKIEFCTNMRSYRIWDIALAIEFFLGPCWGAKVTEALDAKRDTIGPWSQNGCTTTTIGNG